MNSKPEIILPPEWKKVLGKVVLGMLLSLVPLWIGFWISPASEEGFPLPLTPRRAGLRSYQQAAFRWVREVLSAENQLGALLEDQSQSGLFEQNEAINQVTGNLKAVMQELDRKRIPPTLEGLHAAVQEATAKTLEAAGLILEWLTEPSDKKYQAAAQALKAAQDTLELACRNPWLAEGGCD